MSNTLGQCFKNHQLRRKPRPHRRYTYRRVSRRTPITENEIQTELDRRKPGSGIGSTPRAEEDKVEILSGIFEGRTTGAPIVMLVWNRNTDSKDYDKNRFWPAPGTRTSRHLRNTGVLMITEAAAGFSGASPPVLSWPVR